MKLMAIDYGMKRVGIASTDETGKFALPREVVPNDKYLLDKVIKFKEENNIEKIIVGESHNLSGKPNPIMEEILEFKSRLEERGVAVTLHPEVYTTQEAARIQGRDGMTDASAAALILKNYIESVYNK